MILQRSITPIFFQEICSSGGKQTIHKVSVAVSIVKNCHPLTSLSTPLLHLGVKTFSPLLISHALTFDVEF